MMGVGKVCSGRRETEGACDWSPLTHYTILVTSIVEYSWYFVLFASVMNAHKCKGDALDRKRATYGKCFHL